MLQRVYRRLAREIRIFRKLRRARALGIEFLPPNYICRTQLDRSSVVVDVGCADDPELSVFLMGKYGVRAFGVDPTQKHAARLAKFSLESGGRFTHLPLGVANVSGVQKFHESRENISGSLLADHGNVRQDDVVTYPVECVTLPELVRRIGSDSIDLLKLDLEGAEYDLLSHVTADDLRFFKQVFVEFHHHCVDRYSVQNTRQLVRRLTEFGFQFFTLDSHNYLFYRS